jgi:hypothetical protein
MINDIINDINETRKVDEKKESNPSDFAAYLTGLVGDVKPEMPIGSITLEPAFTNNKTT